MKSFQDIFRRIDPSLSFFHDARPADFPSQRFFFFPSMESEQTISFNGEDKESYSVTFCVVRLVLKRIANRYNSFRRIELSK